MRILFFALLFSILFGCISMQAFTAEDIKNPCSIVTAAEVAAVCGLSSLTAEPFPTPVMAKCDYYETKNSTLPLISIAYLPDPGKSYAEYKKSLESFRSNISPSFKVRIEQEDMGLGDRSFLASVRDSEKNKTVGYYLSVFKGSSQIDVFNPNLNESNGCFGPEKSKKIAKLAVSKMMK